MIWLLGLLTVFLPLALCVMEFSSRYPQEGGVYVWSKRAFGDFGGFLTGWIYWISNLPYFPAVLYFAASNSLYVGGTKWQAAQASPAFFISFSLFGIGLALVLNIVGLNVGKWLNNLGAIGTWLPSRCFVWLVRWRGGSSARRPASTPPSLRPSLEVGNFGVWATLLSAFWGADRPPAWAEIKNARRTIPRALIAAGFLITAGYLLGTIAVLVVLPKLNGLEGIMQAISSSAERMGWPGLGPVVALLICVAILGGVGAYLAAISRIPFVACIQFYAGGIREDPSQVGNAVRLAYRAGPPAASVFILMGQFGSTVHAAYELLVSMTIITTFVPYLFMFAAMIRLQREQAETGVVRVPGGKPVAIVVGLLEWWPPCGVIFGSAIPDASEPHKALASGEDRRAERGAAGRRSGAVRGGTEKSDSELVSNQLSEKAVLS